MKKLSQIYNSYSQEIDFTVSNKNEIVINAKTAGLYFVKVIDGKHIYFAKLMKE